MPPVMSDFQHQETPDLGEFQPIIGDFFQKSLVRNRNSPDIFTVTFYERHLWAGLLGWPD